MWELEETFGYEVWGNQGFIGVSGFVRQDGNILIFSDFEVDTLEIKAIIRGW